MKAAMRVVYHDGKWEVRDGESIVRFASSNDAWDYKAARESATMRLWRRFRKAA